MAPVWNPGWWLGDGAKRCGVCPQEWGSGEVPKPTLGDSPASFPGLRLPTGRLMSSLPVKGFGHLPAALLGGGRGPCRPSAALTSQRL